MPPPPKPPDYVTLVGADGSNAVVRTAAVDLIRDANAQERQAGAVAVVVVGGVAMQVDQGLAELQTLLGFVP